MQIFRSLKTNILAQGFKCNPNMVAFYESLGMAKGLHGGSDWGAKDEEPLYFDVSVKGDGGLVLNTEIDNNGGLGINIITEDEDGIFKHRYWHLKRFNVFAGQKVQAGDLIGWADNTGLSTGTHLHRDAKEMIKVNGVYQIKNPNNGTFGTIDYTPYFKNIFVRDFLDTLGQGVGLLQRLIEIAKQIINLKR